MHEPCRLPHAFPFVSTYQDGLGAHLPVEEGGHGEADERGAHQLRHLVQLVVHVGGLLGASRVGLGRREGVYDGGQEDLGLVVLLEDLWEGGGWVWWGVLVRVCVCTYMDHPKSSQRLDRRMTDLVADDDVRQDERAELHRVVRQAQDVYKLVRVGDLCV